MTAEEFCKERALTPYEYVIDALNDYAKYHVEQALNEASKIFNEDYKHTKNSILNAYPLDLIK